MVEKRGKKAVADFEVVPLIPCDAKPPPPPELGEREAVHWRMIVEAMPLRWFGRETWSVLISLCRARVAADLIWPRYLKALEGDSVEDASELSALHAKEVLTIRRLSADLRLTPMARFSNRQVDSVKTSRPIAKPWEG